jgi:outer membrane lipoprotein SlyB
MKKQITACIVLATLLTGCNQPGQNRYGYQDVGRNTEVEFGTVIKSREVDITGQNTGLGATAGAAGGALGGAYIGHGGGTLGAMLATAIIGGVAGHIAEQAIADHKGIEYVVTEANGKTVTIVQNKVDGDELMRKGTRVMIQTSGQYQRVLPADDLPTEVKRPKRIRVKD